jgi:hypothetical protein
MSSSSDAWLASNGSSGGGSSSSAWLSQFGGGGTALPPSRKKSGGGGFGFPGSGVLGNLASDIGSTITGLPNAGKHIADATLYTIEHPIAGFLPGNKKGIEGGLIQPVGKSYAYQYGPLFEGKPGLALHRAGQHPLGPILDALTLLTLGGGAALKGTQLLDKAGMLAEEGRLAQAARGERSISFTPEGSQGLTESLRPGKTLQGRLLQQKLDEYSMAHPDAPIVGAAGKISKITDKRAYNRTQALRVPVRKFQATWKGLTNQEQFALHVAAAGEPLPTRLAYFQSRLIDAPSRALESYVGRLEKLDPKILSDPSPRFVKALDQARGLEQQGGDALVEMGKLSRATREERRFLEQRVIGGAEHVKDEGFVGGPSLATLKGQEAQRLTGAGDTGLSPELGPAFRVPHVVQSESGSAGVYTTPRPPLRKVAAPGSLKENRALRLAGAELSTNPDIFSSDFLATTRYQHQLDMQRNILDPVAQPLDTGLNGGKKAEEFYYWPNKSGTIPRSAREQDAIATDAASQGYVPKDVANAETEAAVTKSRPLDPVTREAMTIQQMNELGIRRVNARFAQKYRSQFGGVSRTERLFFDKPLDVWRALVLKYRPAWMVTNAYGNTILYGLRYDVRGVRGFLRALKAEKGDGPLIKIADMIQVDKRQRMYGPLLEEVAPGLGQSAFFKSQAYVRHSGVYAKDASPHSFMRVASGATLPARVLWKSVKAVGDGIQFLNTHSENVFREAAFLTEAGRSQTIKNLMAYAKSAGETNDLLKAALRNADTPTIEKLSNAALRAMGDYNQLSSFERRFVRKVVPFYSWYRTILTVTAHSVIDEPLKWRLLQMMAETAKDDPNSSVQFPVPSWLEGSIPLSQEKGGKQTVLSTQSANPFSTIEQLGVDAKSLAAGKPNLAVANPGGLLNPFLVAPLVGLYGVDPSFGGTYRGPGEQHGAIGRAAGYLASSNPQYQLYQKQTGGIKSSLYSPEQLDYIWNYLGLPIKRVNVNAAKTRAKG